MATPLRVLFVEDSEDDIQLILRALLRGGYEPQYERVETAADMSAALDRTAWEIVIADHNMPRFSAPAALTLLNDRGFDIPFIIVSGAIGEDLAVAAMKAGAQDYIMKGNLARLAPAVARELREAAERRRRVQMEEALGESERRFHILADTAPAMIWMAGADKFCHYFNKRWLDFTGRTIEEEHGYGWIEGVHRHDFQQCFDTYHAACEARQQFSMEYRLRRADGVYRWVLETGVPRYTPDGSFVGYVGSCIDITERKAAEAELGARALQQATVAELGQRALAGADPAGLLEQTAALVAMTLGVEYSAVLELLPDGETLRLRAGMGWKDGIIGRAIVGAAVDSPEGYALMCDTPVLAESLPEEARFRVPPLLRDHRALSGICTIIYGQERPFGVLSAYTTRHRAFTEDDAHFLQALAHVLTTAIERKRAEAALRESQARLAGIISSAMDAIVTIDADQRITLFNAAAEQMFRCSAAAAIGTPLDCFIPERFRAIHREYINAFGRTNATKRTHRSLGIVTGLRADGEEFPIEASIAQTEVAGQKLYTVIMRDVTERQRCERGLRAISAATAALRAASTYPAIQAVIVDQLQAAAEAHSALLALRDPASGEMVVELAQGGWASLAGSRLQFEAWTGSQHAADQPRVVDNPQGDSSLAWASRAADLRAIAYIPLVVPDQIIGMLWIGRAAGIDAGELRMLATIGDIAASALHRTALHDQAERRLSWLNAVRMIDQALTSSLDLRLTLNILLDQATNLLGVHAADVLIYNPQAQTLEYITGHGFHSAAFPRPPHRLDAGPAGRAARERRWISIANLPEAAEASGYAEMAAAERFIAYDAAPLIAKGQLKGVLELFQRAPGAPIAEWTDFLEIVADAAAMAIDSAGLPDQAQRHADERLVAYS
jgi:PAS domain S-box-containing protein